MAGKVALITGASDGIGAQAAKALKAKGWQVAVIGRNRDKTRRVAEELGAPHYAADFTRLEGVARLAETLKRDWPRVDLLANNAGGIFSRQPLTADGHEVTFQVNHLAHFLLTRLLLDRLVENGATVVSTSSVAHRLIGFGFDPENPDRPPFHSQHLAYGSSKLANVLFTRELHRRYHEMGLNTAAFHPGEVATSFASGMRSPIHMAYQTGITKLLRMKTPEEGADTLVWLAEGTPGRDWESGGYYALRQPAAVSRKGRDEALARALWEKSEAYCRPFLEKDG